MKNILDNYESYSNKMTLSQVIIFFARHDISFTKTMIQNYVKIGLLPVPDGKRYYLKHHIILLDMINSLKEVFSLEEIKNVLNIIIEDVNDIEIVQKAYLDYFKALCKEEKILQKERSLFVLMAKGIIAKKYLIRGIKQ